MGQNVTVMSFLAAVTLPGERWQCAGGRKDRRKYGEADR